MVIGLARGRARHGWASFAGWAGLGVLVIAIAAAGCSSGSQAPKPDGGGGSGGHRDGGGGADRPADRPAGDTGATQIGQPCTAGGECASGYCFDGVCCRTDCSGTCETCAATGSVGTCIPADVGTDPRKECPDDGTASCMRDGFCDGAGACELYASGVICQQAGCSGTTLTFAGRCDGQGTCAATPSQSCTPYVCGSATQCGTTCTTSADCAGGAPCTAGSCGPKPPGASCAAGTDCKSGICAQGVCCSTACTGTCKSCALTASAGVCSSVPEGQDPLGQCAAATAMTCQTDGACDGNGACEEYSSGTICGTDACSAGNETPAGRCDGVGDCVAGAAQSCAPYLCGTGGDCLTKCASNTDCASGYTCVGSICCTGTGCALLGLAATCTSASECASGFCQQGVCCASSCTGTCQSCALTATAGTCSNVPKGTAAATGTCTDMGANACSTDGTCDGTGKCHLYAAGTTCAAATCTGSSYTPARTCDGAGACQSATSQLCNPYVCDTSKNVCKTSCAGASDCVSPATCSTAGSCGLLPNGAACTAGTACNSGFCAQSVCCATACTATCTSCAIATSPGTCVPVPAGQDPLAQCNDAGSATCGTNGFCDGNGACQQYAGGTACATATCTGSTLTPAGACNGTGTCVVPSTTSCAPYVCGSGACKTSCTADTDCVSPNVCTSGTCGGGCPGVYCDNFESDTVGAMPAGWLREGGSNGDWQVITDATKAFAQNHAQSSTFRLCYASGTSWTGATSITAQVKVLALGSSGTTTAMVCVRYSGGSAGDYACLAIEPGTGAQIKVRNSGAVTSGPVWSATLTTGTYYTVELSAAASGALTASLSGTALGTYTPTTPITSGYVAVATQSAEAAFDNVVVTQP